MKEADRPFYLLVKSEKTESEARQRILKTATDLFYRNGYRATGINEIIDKSGVAKATFYAHFPSKEDLAFEYIRTLNQAENQSALTALEKYSGPHEKLIGMFDYLIGWAKERDYRGCAYLNIASEMPDPSHAVRAESRSHYDALRSLSRKLVTDLKVLRGPAWRDRDADKVSEDYLLILSGALTMSQVYHDAKPFRDAAAAAKRLLA
jgi:Transcriptional regulator